MIQSLIMKLAFTPISLYDLKLSSTPRPYALMELSIIVCGCSFIIGWYLTGKRVDALYKKQFESDTTCYNATVKEKPDWMLVVDNKIRFFFKTLYWFSIAYLHSLFVFAFILIFIFSLLICLRGFPSILSVRTLFDNTKTKIYDKPHRVWNSGLGKIEPGVEGTGYNIPGIFTMDGIFVFLQNKFLMLHAVIFVTGLVFFYINCVIFLEVETDSSSKELITKNRERFKFLLNISYIFIDSCYMFFEVVMMLFFECPVGLGAGITQEKKEMLQMELRSLFEPNIDHKIVKSKLETLKNEISGATFKHLNKSIKTNDTFTFSDRMKISRLISSMPNRDEFCMELFQKN